MILLQRRRLFFWLVKAYFRKWGKTILFFFILGLIFFFLITSLLSKYSNKLPFVEKESIGIVGVYTIENLPEEVISKLGRGLTKLDTNGKIKPDLAKSWEVKDGGKTYIFTLKNDLAFTDGSDFDSDSVSYNFTDVAEERPDKKTIVFKLNEPFAPFLASVSRPVFKGNYIGVSDYKIKKIEFNGNFLQSVDLASVKNDYNIISYQVYTSQDALKDAYVLGEVKIAEGITDLTYKETSFKNFKNTSLEKRIDRDILVTLFYNTQDQTLSEKRLRQALSYALPDKFAFGVLNRTPYTNPNSTNADIPNTYTQDFAHSKLLLSQSESATGTARLTLTITTLPKYEDVANQIKDAWKNIDIETKIRVTDSLPSNFQIFLGDFVVSKDPDQYTLWHSQQQNNITNFANLRIDKLLEDGRKTSSEAERRKIYSEFEKYLLDESPASFLFVPYTYTLKRL